MTKIGTYDIHPAAEIPPPMTTDEFNDLVENIREKGQVDPVVLVTVLGRKLVLDGRHRLRACLKLGIKPKFEPYTGKDPEGFVEAKLKHRHLTASQRAMVAEAFAQLRGGQKQTGKFAGQKSQPAAAKSHGVSERYVRHARVVREQTAPSVIEAVRTGRLAVDAGASLAKLPKDQQRAIIERVTKGAGGEVKTGHVRALIRQAHKREVRAQIESERTPMPLGPFRVIVTDPSWEYSNSDGHAGSRGHTPYPTMSENQIIGLGPEMRAIAHDDSLLFCWTTNAHLVDGTAPRVIREWGWHAITAITWIKNKIGMGSWLRNQTEHCILAIRGKPTVTLTNETTVLYGDVREHSRKPEAFYELVEKLCPGDKIEMFCQTPREGWARWGAESDKYAAAG